MEKISSEKVNNPVLAFCIFGHWARTIGLFVENFSLGLSKLQSFSPKTFCRKLSSLEKNFSVSFCFVSVVDWTKSIGVSSKKSTGTSKQHSMCPQERFFFIEKNKISGKNLFFCHFGTWGKKSLPLTNLFPAVVSKFHSICPYDHFDHFFKKLTFFLMTFWQLTEKNFSLSSWKTWPGC